MKFFSAIILILCSSAVWADGKLKVPANAKWQDECGSCHVAYPPQLLTAANWQQMMQKLGKHFGANAEMDMRDAQEISAFLQRHAGRGSNHAASSLRITDTRWFKREHDEVSNKTWADPAIGSRANCTACHVKAEQGDWSERSIRMPGGRGGEDEGDDEDDEEDEDD